MRTCSLGVRSLVALRFAVDNREYFVFLYKECTTCEAKEQRSVKYRVIEKDGRDMKPL
jgi:hypothetical protein